MIQLITEKIQFRRLEGPVLAAFIDLRKMEKVVASSGVTDVVFVPWAAEEHAGYLSTYPDSKELFRSPKFDDGVANVAFPQIAPSPAPAKDDGIGRTRYQSCVPGSTWPKLRIALRVAETPAE
ncbi:hypothetical protein [Comamonas sp. BIGb0124]|uniref:hypothetical protein n=1 Tax=Comamonas sp. BIGb0124 TaxID=2485130 RepID=UPI001315626B|nr:hypothetical protein [Comamonas sp. BIGb0124]